MPVTAKLSRKFYECFGDDIAGELVDWFNAVDQTYQTQLREMNDLNWERFKATLLAESASIRSELREGLAQLRGELAAMGAELRGELAAMGAELRGEIAATRGELRGEFAVMRGELRGEMDSGIAGLRSEMGAMRADLIKWMFIFWTGTMVGLGGLIFAILRTR